MIRQTRCALVTGVQTCALPIYRYARLSGNPLGPSCKAVRRSFERRVVVAPCAGIENVDSSVDQWTEYLLKLRRAGCEACGVILLLPLREPKENRLFLANVSPHRTHDLHGEPPASMQISAPAILPAIAAAPEKSIDHVDRKSTRLHSSH